MRGIHYMASQVNIELADAILANSDKLEYSGSHLKEIEVVECLSNAVHAQMSKYYGSKVAPERERYILFQELLSPENLSHYNTELSPELWSFDDVKAVIDASVGFQSISISDASREALQNVQSIDANELCYLYVKLLEQCKVEFDSLKKEDVAWVKLRINNKIEVGGVKVLVNNDFNLRNIAIRVGSEVAIYDWELAVFGLPLRVLVEFLSFVITDDWTDDQIHEMVSYHISELEGPQLVTFRMIGGKTS
jgi:hypothetical protein